ncbi:50S ribosomal protein L21 [Candidatus Kinetoplastibacterium sorsogonicusi]|uniref:Large ribosomal subunit protein bL21 n=1 Tax=Candidatus Kinetoplastidibacterium kentomonadis TaxID=1576550 RepID=A0A3Q8EUM3_9PROT|nr:50S ribosomal protein L21 [Candidatus Kinetoplastibacterium sorsogonicusi]AWD32705.1 50S ribosomal protein L21 [Candidatus Kinetoplastibacterium sorsogonicusi]
MYAVIKTGGKQYRVSPGEKLKIEQILADIGDEISFKDVLSIGEGDKIEIGSPFLKDVVVKAKVLSHGKNKKIKIFKMRRRKHYQKHQGHRQSYTELYIDSIVNN